jgi:NAD(P)-dependent dehydrogenase (short-subunit alcohol dehydrogenase family)
MSTILKKFKLNNKVAIITGGAGLLGVKHAEVIAEAGGIPVLWDINFQAVQDRSKEIAKRYGVSCLGMNVDITDPESVKNGVNEVLKTLQRIDILINNAANDPKVAPGEDEALSRLENFSLEMWQKDIAVGLTGTFLCSRTVGLYMAKYGGGVILNIASDLGIIAPDQRIYRKEGIDETKQPVKPVTYSVVKHGTIGLTKYLATYWAENKVRVNAISPGGIYTNQPEDFVKKLTGLIPMGRMAQHDEYKAAVLFLISDASSYMTGANLIMDGGRTCW